MDPQLRKIIDLEGVFLRREARDLGYHDNTIDRLVRDHTFHRVRWGSYTYSVIWDELDTSARYGLLCRAAVRRAQTKVVLSHVSATNAWAAPLWEADLTEVHLTREDEKAGRREAGIAQHRGRLLDGDLQQVDGLFVMSPTRAALEITTMLDVEHSMVEIDDLLHRKLTTPEQLAHRLELMNHWPATLHTDLVLRLVDGRAESVGETRIRYLCWAQGLPTPEVNVEIRDRAGRVIHRVDLAWPDFGLFLEFDGKEKYQRYLRDNESVVDCVVREKRREDLICELTGWRCIRIVWADLYQPERTAARIKNLLRARAA